MTRGASENILRETLPSSSISSVFSSSLRASVVAFIWYVVALFLLHFPALTEERYFSTSQLRIKSIFSFVICRVPPKLSA